MTVETATYVASLNPALPVISDSRQEGYLHLDLIKKTIVNSFPNVAGAVTVAHTDLNTVTAKGNITGQVWSGAHDFTAGSAAVPTAAALDATTKAASTAFVQNAIIGVNVYAAPLTLTISSTATVALASGQQDCATYAGQVTWTAPPSPSAGMYCSVIVGNSRIDSVFARNTGDGHSYPIMGLAQDLSITPSTPGAVTFRFISATLGWCLT